VAGLATEAKAPHSPGGPAAPLGKKRDALAGRTVIDAPTTGSGAKCATALARKATRERGGVWCVVRQKAAGPERSGSPLSREPDERTQRGRGEGNERAGGTWQRIDSRADYRVTLRNTRGRGEKERRREEGC